MGTHLPGGGSGTHLPEKPRAPRAHVPRAHVPEKQKQNVNNYSGLSEDRREIGAAIQVGSHTVRVVRKDDLIAMKRRAAADPGRRRSKALRDLADLELLLGDVPDPDEGW